MAEAPARRRRAEEEEAAATDPAAETEGDSSDYTSEDEGTEEYRRGGYHAVRVGDSFNKGAYVVQSKLGWGHFSTVWLAWDTNHSRYVALKVQKSAQHYTEAAMDEIKILKQIADGDPDDSRCVVKLLDHFKHSGPNGNHVCMVFEFLGDNLLTLIKYTDYHGIPLPMVKEICRHVLVGLDYLHRVLAIIHTDLKPENILLVSTIDPSKNPRKSGVPLVLPATEADDPPPKAPAPSVNGGPTKSQKKKIRRKAKRAATATSEGSGAVASGDTDGSDDRGDLSTANEGSPNQDGDNKGDKGTRRGDVLFDPHSGDNFERDEDHLALMMELLGMMPRKIALGGRYSREFFNRYGDLRHIRRLRFWPLNKVLVDKYRFSERDSNDMADFLVPILDFVPGKRPVAAQLLQHPWLDAGPFHRQPKTLPDPTENSVDVVSEKQRFENQERDAMAMGLGNIAIDGATSKTTEDPQASTMPNKTNATPAMK
ncbi:hypothetical protein GUJ93_ZPchr0013g36867 [Zizania palustris]|uniref:non-specific serine/threonine protein kinase n=1 Tax=Zizania palustris TaxID=103762 RepID=A0A8J6BX97_ZIZPA|nr:hypothetical protein GUJ93_ZPchr0013g36867 [Zizania palustris]